MCDTVRNYYKCQDCLSPVAIDEEKGANILAEHICGACGGKLSFMGKVTGNTFARTEHLCKCDGRCVSAAGPDCDCACRGENHGSGMLGYVEVVAVTGQVKITPVDASKCKKIAEEFRSAFSSAKAQLERLPGYAKYSGGQWVDSDSYWAIRDAQQRISKALNMQSHKGRMAAFARIINLDGAQTA